jgi:hypothetical protein
MSAKIHGKISDLAYECTMMHSAFTRDELLDDFHSTVLDVNKTMGSVQKFRKDIEDALYNKLDFWRDAVTVIKSSAETLQQWKIDSTIDAERANENGMQYGNFDSAREPQRNLRSSSKTPVRPTAEVVDLACEEETCEEPSSRSRSRASMDLSESRKGDRPIMQNIDSSISVENMNYKRPVLITERVVMMEENSSGNKRGAFRPSDAPGLIGNGVSSEENTELIPTRTDGYNVDYDGTSVSQNLPIETGKRDREEKDEVKNVDLGDTDSDNEPPMPENVKKKHCQVVASSTSQRIGSGPAAIDLTSDE